MKPQCTTASQCLKELARVMEQFGIESVDNALRSKYVKSDLFYIPDFAYPGTVHFAIAEVEGKPVFPGDKLYGNLGLEFVAYEVFDGFLCEEGYSSRNSGVSQHPSRCSWNPPKPNTIMIEMRVSSAAEIARYFRKADLITTDLYDAVTSIEKALKGIE